MRATHTVEVFEVRHNELDPRRRRSLVGMMLFDNEAEANAYAASQNEDGEESSTYAYARAARKDDRQFA